MTVDRTIKISDLLTSLTILVSVITLTVSWSKDRLTREKEQADRVRSAAAKTLTQLDRWQALQLSIFRELQPVFVETSEMLVDNFNSIFKFFQVDSMGMCRMTSSTRYFK
jgi:hypothetical protein